MSGSARPRILLHKCGRLAGVAAERAPARDPRITAPVSGRQMALAHPLMLCANLHRGSHLGQCDRAGSPRDEEEGMGNRLATHPPKRDSATEAEVGLTESAVSAAAAQGALPPDYFPRAWMTQKATSPPQFLLDAHDIPGPRPAPVLTSAHPEHRTARTAGSQEPGLLPHTAEGQRRQRRAARRGGEHPQAGPTGKRGGERRVGASSELAQATAWTADVAEDSLQAEREQLLPSTAGWRMRHRRSMPLISDISEDGEARWTPRS